MGTKQVTHILIVESEKAQADLIRQAFKDSDVHLTFTSNLADARASKGGKGPISTDTKDNDHSPSRCRNDGRFHQQC